MSIVLVSLTTILRSELLACRVLGSGSPSDGYYTSSRRFQFPVRAVGTTSRWTKRPGVYTFLTEPRWKCSTSIPTLVGNIPKTLGVHGIAIAPELGRGFVSNGQASTVTIFDLEDAEAIADVPTGKKPDAIIYDPATSRVFAFNGGSNSATAIDAATGKVAGTVDLGGGPEFAVADGNGYCLRQPGR